MRPAHLLTVWGGGCPGGMHTLDPEADLPLTDPEADTPPTGQTNICENITFSQTSFAGSNKYSLNLLFHLETNYSSDGGTRTADCTGARRFCGWTRKRRHKGSVRHAGR